MAFKNKKGWFDIVLLVVILLFAFGAITMFIGNVFDDITSEITADDTLSNSSKAVIENTNSRYTAIMDGGFALVLGLLFLFCLFVSYNSTDNAFFKVVAFVVMILLVLAAVLLGSVYGEISDDNSLASSFSDYTFTNWVLSNFAVVVIVFIGSMIAMMAFGGRDAY